MTLTDTIAALCWAIDQGDDSALPILADAMDEAGDPRATGLRRVGDRRPIRNRRHTMYWGWKWKAGVKHHRYLDSRTAYRLPKAWSGCETDGYIAKFYLTRSAAFFALAAALMETADGR